MCFSAGASFGASAILGTIGIVTLKKAKTTNQIPFASIPLLFGAQQAAEGALWIGLSSGNNESWRTFPGLYLSDICPARLARLDTFFHSAA